METKRPDAKQFKELFSLHMSSESEDDIALPAKPRNTEESTAPRMQATSEPMDLDPESSPQIFNNKKQPRTGSQETPKSAGSRARWSAGDELDLCNRVLGAMKSGQSSGMMYARGLDKEHIQFWNDVCRGFREKTAKIWSDYQIRDKFRKLTAMYQNGILLRRTKAGHSQELCSIFKEILSSVEKPIGADAAAAFHTPSSKDAMQLVKKSEETRSTPRRSRRKSVKFQVPLEDGNESLEGATSKIPDHESLKGSGGETPESRRKKKMYKMSPGTLTCVVALPSSASRKLSWGLRSQTMVEQAVNGEVTGKENENPKQVKHGITSYTDQNLNQGGEQVVGNGDQNPKVDQREGIGDGSSKGEKNAVDDEIIRKSGKLSEKIESCKLNSENNLFTFLERELLSVTAQELRHKDRNIDSMFKGNVASTEVKGASMVGEYPQMPDSSRNIANGADEGTRIDKTGQMLEEKNDGVLHKEESVKAQIPLKRKKTWKKAVVLEESRFASDIRRTKDIRWTYEDEITIALAVLDAKGRGLLHHRLKSDYLWKKNSALWDEVQRQVRHKTRKECTSNDVLEKFMKMKTAFLRNKKRGLKSVANLKSNEKKLYDIIRTILYRKSGGNKPVTGKQIAEKEQQPRELHEEQGIQKKERAGKENIAKAKSCFQEQQDQSEKAGDQVASKPNAGVEMVNKDSNLAATVQETNVPCKANEKTIAVENSAPDSTVDNASGNGDIAANSTNEKASEPVLALYRQIWEDCEKKMQGMECRLRSFLNDKINELKEEQRNREEARTKNVSQPHDLENQLRYKIRKLEIKQELCKIEQEEIARLYTLYNLRSPGN